MATLSLRGLSKRFGLVKAIAAIDIEVVEREFVFLVGPSGCGTSTILRMIAGIETPSPAISRSMTCSSGNVGSHQPERNS